MKNIFAIGPGCWGKAASIKEAIRNARKAHSARFGKFRVLALYETTDQGAFVDGLGRFCAFDGQYIKLPIPAKM